MFATDLNTYEATRTIWIYCISNPKYTKLFSLKTFYTFWLLRLFWKRVLFFSQNCCFSNRVLVMIIVLTVNLILLEKLSLKCITGVSTALIIDWYSVILRVVYTVDTKLNRRAIADLILYQLYITLYESRSLNTIVS